MDITIAVFVRNILGVVREACKREGIKQGAISVCISPVQIEETAWAGMPAGVSEVSFTSSIVPFTDTTLFFEKEGFVGDAAGIVAMKIAAAKSVMAKYAKEGLTPPRHKCTSGSISDDMLGDGIVNWKGAVAIPIDVVRKCGRHAAYHCTTYYVRAINVYVAVSGGTEEQDEAAAWCALGPIEAMLESELDYKLPDEY